MGNGPIDLAGSSTIPATLSFAASANIVNPITIAGDPVIEVASGTTTTISAPITDAGLANDLVVTGGGTLELAAANTFTGPTYISAGATLALSGNGSIAQSGAVINNGSLNVSAKVGNISLGGAYTQTSLGSLTMSFSPFSNQKINIAGFAALDGSLNLLAGEGSYRAGRYKLISSNGIAGSFAVFASNIANYTNMAYTLSYDSNDVYLMLTPNASNTQQSLEISAEALQNTFIIQNAVLTNSFSYDCGEFGANNICVSAGGRNTAASSASGFSNAGALLIGAYRPLRNFRIGAYIDQNMSSNNNGGTVTLGTNTPLLGLFGVWSQSDDGTGAEVKVSAGYGQKNAIITRQVIGSSEPGSGSSQLISQGAQATVKYGLNLSQEFLVAPYIGTRYTQNSMAAYAESSTSAVAMPLNYEAIKTSATTVLIGTGGVYRFIPQAGIYGSAGVEWDVRTANGAYVAHGIDGLAPINLNSNPVALRPTATLGAYYEPQKNQRISVSGIYRQEPFQSLSTTSVMLNYAVGI